MMQTQKTWLTTADGFKSFPLDHPGSSWILRDQSSQTTVEITHSTCKGSIHQSTKCVYRSWGILLYMWKKPRMAPGEAACNLINCLHWCCIVGSVGTRFWEASLAKWSKVIKQKYRLFYSTHSSKPGAYIAHNATQPPNDITGGNLSDLHFHIWSRTPQDL